jgi:flagellar M-ring protein FliF
MATPAEVLEQIKALYEKLTLTHKLIGAGALILIIVAITTFVLVTGQVKYRTLYTDLAVEDAADVVTWIKNAGIPYKLLKEGSTVQIPEEKIYDTRLALASAGLPRKSGVGYELFDKTGLGTTDFVYQVNYQRAMQGEIERTIQRFPQVKSVRVHLAQPKETLFISEKKEPSVSVVIEFKKNETLTSDQVNGIIHLVASAIPKLKKENVSVVDTQGNILNTEEKPAEKFAHLTNAQLLYQKKMEDYFKHKIQSMLDGALGESKSVARVSVELDFDESQISEDRYNPDETAVRSEQKLSETDLVDSEGGIPGVKGGLADKLQGNANVKQGPSITRQKKQDTANYEISRVQKQVNSALGKVKRVSAGVIVDGVYKKEGKEMKYQSRSAEELKGLEQIVKAGIGFSQERGDEVSVVNIPFTIQPEKVDMSSLYTTVGDKILTPLVYLIIVLVIIFFVVRPLINKYLFPEKKVEEAVQEALPPGEELPEVFEGPKLPPLPDIKTQLQSLASDYPERAAALIKIWLREKVDEEPSNA